MDYLGILKEAWSITWKHRTLWVLGLFLGASGGSGGSSNFSTSGGDFSGDDPFSEAGRGFDQAFDAIGQVIEDNVGLIVAVITFFVLVAVITWVLRIAARGGMIDQTNEAVAGRVVSARLGWATGFRNWGKVFLIEFMLYLPAIVFSLLAVGLVIVGIASFDDGLVCGSAALAFGLIGLAAIAGIAASFMIEVALRRGVLDGYGAVEAIKVAWADWRGRKGVGLMWLVMLAVGFAFGLASTVVFVPLVLMMGLVIFGAWNSMGDGAWWLLLPMGAILFAAGLLVSAIYGTFVNAAWTSFFARMKSPAAFAKATESQWQTAAEQPLPPPPTVTPPGTGPPAGA